MNSCTHNSPSEILRSRRKVNCPICTVQVDRPIMLEEGPEWEAHRRTRVHRRLLRSASEAAKKQYEDLSSNSECNEFVH